MNETMATIVGNVTGDLKSRRTADGARVVTFRVASNERRFDRASQQWVDGDTLFMTVVCWRALAVGVMGSLAKGDPVIVTGRVYTRGYEVEGRRRSVVEMEATTVGPDLARCTAEVRRKRHLALADLAGVQAGSGNDEVAPGEGQATDELADALAGALAGEVAALGASAQPLEAADPGGVVGPASVAGG